MQTTVRLVLSSMALMFFASSVAAQKPYPTDTVVAKRGDAVVTMLDIDAALMGVPDRLRANVMNSPKRIEELIERLLAARQLALKGDALALDDTAVFKQAVAQQADRLLGEQYLIEYRANLKLGDVKELARERYLVNPEAYATPGYTSARHILVDTRSRTDQEALELAKEIQAKAVAGDDFVALVTQYSDDPSNESNQGLIPNADSVDMDPAFAAAVKRLAAPGDISPVVKSQFGYHVIVLVQRTPSTPRSFDQVEEKIVAEIDNSMREARLKEHVDSLKSMEIEAVPDVVASLRTRYLPESASAETAVEKSDN